MNKKNRSNQSKLERIIEVECLRLSSEGAGVGYHDGRATFVAGLLPGETGKVQIFEEKKSWQRGRLIDVLDATVSSQRVNPPCTVYGLCGGCQLQHLSYPETLAWKKRWVADNLMRIGKIAMDDVIMHPTMGMEDPWRYRNKGRFHRGVDHRLGYHQEKSNTIVRFTDCLLISEPMNRWLKEIEDILLKEAPEIKALTLRENSHGEGMLVLEPVSDGGSLRELLGKMDSLSIESNGNSKRAGIRSIWGVSAAGKPELLIGEGDFRQEILGLEYKVSPLAFLQVNPIQTQKLYTTVLQWAQRSPAEVVWDLYSGIGTITLALAAKAQKVWGIEENPYAVEDARMNAQHNRIENVEFIAGKVEDTFQEIDEHPDLVVLDPPRAGAHRRVLEGLIKLQPQQIICVSCDPGTLARDLGILQSGGYQVREVQPVDMFGWTAHVECIIMMTNSGLKGK
ncbi:23S rRNA (uracil-5-)-methyltransferase RumA [Desulfitobacterium dichloroeliminans LMG P-21439]|uniref:23S rRNA (Uracil-5-)-methyltransferase RumA n=1 Tax=Desulfitobacterium dichloroeliminans (strain LMG P-21439 / DCA1) TaxID=871963 RepID=L0F743_DESDL|nr:23S rRNA (uracil(1939)-C(5))-methyltransferase RlmD [Desulfitobacterium dichloroeliminans]AGA68783.1 23S rRNA (uracil-5-)-methyltransferase RumA [Desulfitobacterium dichloroeliminans LMG P-21439]